MLFYMYFPKRFMCPMFECRKRYSDPSSLRKHLKGLHGESSYLAFRKLKNSVRMWEKNFRIKNDINGNAHIVGLNGENINFDEAINSINDINDSELNHHQNFGDLPDEDISDELQEGTSGYRHLPNRKFLYPFPPPFYHPMAPYWSYPFTNFPGIPHPQQMPMPPFFFGGFHPFPFSDETFDVPPMSLNSTFGMMFPPMHKSHNLVQETKPTSIITTSESVDDNSQKSDNENAQSLDTLSEDLKEPINPIEQPMLAVDESTPSSHEFTTN